MYDKDEEWMEIVNLDKLIQFSRKLIFYNFDEANDDLDTEEFMNKVERIKDRDIHEIELLLPIKECRQIFEELTMSKRHKKTKILTHFIKDDNYDIVLERLNQRMISNMVQGLVKKGVLETGFDNDRNDFVFWIKKDDDADNKEAE